MITSRNDIDIPDRIPASFTPPSRKGVSPSLSVAKVRLTSQEYSKVRCTRMTIAVSVRQVSEQAEQEASWSPAAGWESCLGPYSHVHSEFGVC